MRFSKLTEADKQLIKVALETIKRNRTETKSFSSSVGAALIAESGRVYCATNIKSYSSAPTSIDAEAAAIACMFANGERKIKTIVAVHMPDRNGNAWHVFQPCGACRHIISQFGNPWVIISKTKKVRLSDLYPMPVRPVRLPLKNHGYVGKK